MSATLWLLIIAGTAAYSSPVVGPIFSTEQGCLMSANSVYAESRKRRDLPGHNHIQQLDAICVPIKQ